MELSCAHQGAPVGVCARAVDDKAKRVRRGTEPFGHFRQDRRFALPDVGSSTRWGGIPKRQQCGAESGSRIQQGRKSIQITLYPAFGKSLGLSIAYLQKMAVAERTEGGPTTGRRNEVGLAVRQATIELLAESCRQ